MIGGRMMAELGDVACSRDMSVGTVSWSPGTLATALTADKGSQWGTHPDSAQEATQTYPVSFCSTGCQTEAVFPVISETNGDIFKTGVCCEKCGRFFVHKDTADKHWWLNHFVVSQGELLQLFGGTKSPYSSRVRQRVQVHKGTPAKEDTCRTSPGHCPGKTSCRKRERRKDSGAHICGVCKKHFATEWTLVFHARSHTGEAPHVCGVCQKRFYWKRQLTSHMWVHDKPNACQFCPQRFTNKRSLVAHLKRHEARARENFHSCGVCQELFPDRGSLVDHEKSVHPSAIEERYACIACHEVFSEKAGLLSHQCKRILQRMLSLRKVPH